MSRDISLLSATMQTLFAEFEMRAKSIGIDFIVTCTSRNNLEQAIAHAEGHSLAGPGKSPHNCVPAEAFDVAVIRNGKAIWNGDDSSYLTLGEIGKSIGLKWGGDFKNLYDPGHFQNPNWRLENKP